MLSHFYKFGILLCLLVSSLSSHGQLGIYLQIEEINSLELIKYYPGQTLIFSTHEYPDAWRKSKIIKIIPEDQLIILDEGYITPDEIHSVRRNNNGVLAVGHALEKFAGTWLLYGAYASIIPGTGYKMSWREVIIGVVAAGVGWTLRKLFGKKRYPMKNLYRVRIMDIRFPAPKFETP